MLIYKLMKPNLTTLGYKNIAVLMNLGRFMLDSGKMSDGIILQCICDGKSVTLVDVDLTSEIMDGVYKLIEVSYTGRRTINKTTNVF